MSKNSQNYPVIARTIHKKKLKNLQKIDYSQRKMIVLFHLSEDTLGYFFLLVLVVYSMNSESKLFHMTAYIGLWYES